MTPNAALPPRGTALLLALVTALLLFRLGEAPLLGPGALGREVEQLQGRAQIFVDGNLLLHLDIADTI